MSGARLTIRIDFPGGARLGPGKIRLLELIAENGSIRAGGAGMGMSYRRAWLLVDSLNKAFGGPLVITQHGGKAGGGAELTALGIEIIARYRALEAAAHSAAGSEIDKLMQLAERESAGLE